MPLRVSSQRGQRIVHADQHILRLLRSVMRDLSTALTAFASVEMTRDATSVTSYSGT